MTSDDQQQQKKPYHSPVIEVYGDLSTITKNIGNLGSVADGGHGSTKKTS